MRNLQKIQPFNEEGLLQVIIETPKGSRNKFAFDTELEMFKLKKVLPVGAVFPYDFGFIPGTSGDDRDPLDVLLLMDEPAFPGCLVEARLLGVMEASQTKNGKTLRNDRFLATACKSKGLFQPATIKGLSKDSLEQIEHFFVSYNEIQGRKFKVQRLLGPDAAGKLIERGAKKFCEQAE